MTTTDIHVVFGTGQVGSALVSHLSAEGKQVRAVSLHQPRDRTPGVEYLNVDVTDHEAAVRAASGALVIYQCLGAPYTMWPTVFPPMQRSVINAAERTGALLVSLENVYAYGPTGGVTMVETTAIAATSTKGRVRAQMTRDLAAAATAGRIRSAIGRASDFFGPGVTQSTLGSRVFSNALAHKKADFIGNPSLLHTYSYVPDIARGLATLGSDERAIGETFHLPGPQTTTTNDVISMIGELIGHHVAIRRVPKHHVSILSIFNPAMRGLTEMSYEFDARSLSTRPSLRPHSDDR